MQSKEEYVKETNHQLFSERYRPKRLIDLVINKKKLEEFKTFMESDRKKILVIQGPPGCGKNTLVETYGNEHDIKVCKLKSYKMLCFDTIYDEKKVNNNESQFEEVMEFIKTNCMNGERKGKNSSFLFKKIKKSHSATKHNKDISQKKIAILNGLPEGFTTFSPKKLEMLSHFNTRLEAIGDEPQATNLLVITLSDSCQRSKNFLSKIFNSKILSYSGDKVKRLELNPITEK